MLHMDIYNYFLFLCKAAGADVCTDCKAGYYCDEVATTQTDMEYNNKCPAGMFCDVGTAEPPNLYNYSCPAGFYCQRGDLVGERV